MNTNEAVKRPPKRARRRRLVAMDVENINGGAVCCVAHGELAWREVARAIGWAEHDQVVIGVGPSSLLAAGLGCPKARRVMGRGINGADLALIDVLRDEHVAERFDEIVIASGDGIFADVAARLALEGARVTVVARDGHLSKRLRLAAGEVVLIASDDPIFGRAA